MSSLSSSAKDSQLLDLQQKLAVQVSIQTRYTQHAYNTGSVNMNGVELVCGVDACAYYVWLWNMIASLDAQRIWCTFIDHRLMMQTMLTQLTNGCAMRDLRDSYGCHIH